MADDDVIANHITLRDGVCQYVRRVPENLRDAFSFARIQKSLGTRDKRAAREAALALDREWDRRFAEERQRRGLRTDDAGMVVTHGTAAWTWTDWEALARWFEATLIEEDWRARLSRASGRLFSSQVDLSALPRRDNAVVREHIDRGEALLAMTVQTHTHERQAFVGRYMRRVGVSLSRTNPYFERFMAACIAAELAYLDVFRLRDSRKGGLGHAHPATIPGPWRRVTPDPIIVAPTAPSPVSEAPRSGTARVGKTLADCGAK